MLGHGSCGAKMTIVKKIDNVVKANDGWKKVWDDAGSGNTKNYAIWVGTSTDSDYVPMGVLCRFGVSNHDAPPRQVAMINKKYCEPTSAKAEQWSDSKTGAHKSVTLALLKDENRLWPTRATFMTTLPTAYKIKFCGETTNDRPYISYAVGRNLQMTIKSVQNNNDSSGFLGYTNDPQTHLYSTLSVAESPTYKTWLITKNDNGFYKIVAKKHPDCEITGEIDLFYVLYLCNNLPPFISVSRNSPCNWSFEYQPSSSKTHYKIKFRQGITFRDFVLAYDTKDNAVKIVEDIESQPDNIACIWDIQNVPTKSQVESYGI